MLRQKQQPTRPKVCHPSKLKRSPASSSQIRPRTNSKQHNGNLRHPPPSAQTMPTHLTSTTLQSPPPSLNPTRIPHIHSPRRPCHSPPGSRRTNTHSSQPLSASSLSTNSAKPLTPPLSQSRRLFSGFGEEDGGGGGGGRRPPPAPWRYKYGLGPGLNAPRLDPKIRGVGIVDPSRPLEYDVASVTKSKIAAKNRKKSSQIQVLPASIKYRIGVHRPGGRRTLAPISHEAMEEMKERMREEKEELARMMQEEIDDIGPDGQQRLTDLPALPLLYPPLGLNGHDAMALWRRENLWKQSWDELREFHTTQPGHLQFTHQIPLCNPREEHLAELLTMVPRCNSVHDVPKLIGELITFMNHFGGIFHPAILPRPNDFSPTNYGSWGIYATQDIPAFTCILSVPTPLMMQSHVPLFSVRNGDPVDIIGPDLYPVLKKAGSYGLHVRLFLELANYFESPYRPYLDTLPKAFPQSPAYKALFQGTPVGDTLSLEVRQHLEELELLSYRGYEIVKDFIINKVPKEWYPEIDYTFEAHQHIETLIFTRGFDMDRRLMHLAGEHDDDYWLDEMNDLPDHQKNSKRQQDLLGDGAAEDNTPLFSAKYRELAEKGKAAEKVRQKEGQKANTPNFSAKHRQHKKKDAVLDHIMSPTTPVLIPFADLFNHSNAPNIDWFYGEYGLAEAQLRLDNPTALREDHWTENALYFFTKRPVYRGEELVRGYQKGPEDYYNHLPKIMPLSHETAQTYARVISQPLPRLTIELPAHSPSNKEFNPKGQLTGLIAHREKEDQLVPKPKKKRDSTEPYRFQTPPEHDPHHPSQFLPTPYEYAEEYSIILSQYPDENPLTNLSLTKVLRTNLIRFPYLSLENFTPVQDNYPHLSLFWMHGLQTKGTHLPYWTKNAIDPESKEPVLMDERGHFFIKTPFFQDFDSLSNIFNLSSKYYNTSLANTGQYDLLEHPTYLQQVERVVAFHLERKADNSFPVDHLSMHRPPTIDSRAPLLFNPNIDNLPDDVVSLLTDLLDSVNTRAKRHDSLKQTLTGQLRSKFGSIVKQKKIFHQKNEAEAKQQHDDLTLDEKMKSQLQEIDPLTGIPIPKPKLVPAKETFRPDDPSQAERYNKWSFRDLIGSLDAADDLQDLLSDPEIQKDSTITKLYPFRFGPSYISPELEAICYLIAAAATNTHILNPGMYHNLLRQIRDVFDPDRLLKEKHAKIKEVVAVHRGHTEATKFGLDPGPVPEDRNIDMEELEKPDGNFREQNRLHQTRQYFSMGPAKKGVPVDIFGPLHRPAYAVMLGIMHSLLSGQNPDIDSGFRGKGMVNLLDEEVLSSFRNPTLHKESLERSKANRFEMAQEANDQNPSTTPQSLVSLSQPSKVRFGYGLPPMVAQDRHDELLHTFVQNEPTLVSHLIGDLVELPPLHPSGQPYRDYMFENVHDRGRLLTPEEEDELDRLENEEQEDERIAELQRKSGIGPDFKAGYEKFEKMKTKHEKRVRDGNDDGYATDDDNSDDVDDVDVDGDDDDGDDDDDDGDSDSTDDSTQSDLERGEGMHMAMPPPKKTSVSLRLQKLSKEKRYRLVARQAIPQNMWSQRDLATYQFNSDAMRLYNPDPRESTVHNHHSDHPFVLSPVQKEVADQITRETIQQFENIPNYTIQHIFNSIATTLRVKNKYWDIDSIIDCKQPVNCELEPNNLSNQIRNYSHNSPIGYVPAV